MACMAAPAQAHLKGSSAASATSSGRIMFSATILSAKGSGQAAHAHGGVSQLWPVASGSRMQGA